VPLLAAAIRPTPKLVTAVPTPLQFATTEDEKSRWQIWLTVAVLVLLGHLLFSLMDIDWKTPAPPMPVEINQVDPQKLAQIRKEWSKKNQQSILIDKDKNRPADAKPKDAKYFSDKNIKVDKEQIARDKNVLPKPGTPGPQAKAQTKSKPAAPKVQAAPKMDSLPDLSKLGVPFPTPKPKPPEEQTDAPFQQENQRAADDAGDQNVDRRDLPQGSENMLNAEESVYYSFYSRMYEAIAPVWQSKVREVTPTQRILPGDYTTVVDVVMDAEGNLTQVRQIQSSGVAVLDEAVETSWKKIGHFPNPPKDLLNPQGEVHTGWTFTVQLQQGAGMEYLPPARVY
jgi:TonB family protein